MNGYRCFNICDLELESVSLGSTGSERRNFPAAILCGRNRIHERDSRKPLQKPGPVVKADVNVQPKRSLAAPSSNAPRVEEKSPAKSGETKLPWSLHVGVCGTGCSTSVF